MDVDFKGNMNLLEQAKLQNVSKFIYVSLGKDPKITHICQINECEFQTTKMLQ